jgi:hypothetical protein
VERLGEDGFADVARQYCAWAEAAPSAPLDELRMALDLLPRLYSAALSLPREWPDTEAAGPPDAPSISWKEIYKRFAPVPVGYYVDALEPLSPGSTEVGTGDVHDDLADIYSDLKEGLWLQQQGHPGLAAAHWGATFWAHWGDHCTGALRALHCYATDPGAT